MFFSIQEIYFTSYNKFFLQIVLSYTDTLKIKRKNYGKKFQRGVETSKILLSYQ